MHEKVQFGPSRKKDASLFLDCFRGVTKHREYWNKWVVDECWIDVINKRYDMPESIRFTAVELNRAISRNAGFQAAGIDSLTLANSLGVYKSSYQPPQKPGTSHRRVTGYYITTPGNKPSEMPGGNSKWYTTLVNEMPSAASTRQNPIKRNLPEELTPATTPVPALKKRKGIATRRSNPKNVRINNFESTETKENVVDLTRSNNGQFEPPTQVLVGHKHKTSADIKPSAAAPAVANQSWCESPEAHVFFCDVKRTPGENGELLFPCDYLDTLVDIL